MVLVNSIKNPYQEAKQRFGTATPAEQALKCLDKIEALEAAVKKIMDVLLEEPKEPQEPKAKRKTKAIA